MRLYCIGLSADEIDLAVAALDLLASHPNIKDCILPRLLTPLATLKANLARLAEVAQQDIRRSGHLDN